MAIESHEVNARLPVEIWRLILGCLYWDSPSSLKALNQSCHQFHELVLPLFFQYIDIHFLKKNSKGKELLQFLAADDTDPMISQCVRVVIISGSFPGFDEEINLLRHFLEKSERLDVMKWNTNYPIPMTIFEHLDQRQPTPHLYIESRASGLTSAISPRPLLHSVSLAWYPWNKPASSFIKRLILSSPSLNTCKLKGFSSDYSGNTSEDTPSFILSPNDIFPPIKTLHAINCRFPSGQAEIWAQCLQFNNLRHLTLHDRIDILDLLTHLTGRVPDLTSFEIRIWNCSTTDSSHICMVLEAFLKEINSLESFTAYGLPKAVLPIIKSLHGVNLRKFRFRETSFENMMMNSRQRSSVSYEELKDLASSLLRVETLGIDLKFEGRLSSYDILSGLASFPRLRHLEINAPFPLKEGLVGPALALTHPHINEAMAEDVFKYVAGEKGYYRKVLDQNEHWLSLEAVDIKVGQWEPFLTGTIHLGGGEKSNHIFACRRVDGFARKLKTSVIPINKFILDDDDRYERALASVGLWDRLKVL